MKQTQVHRLKYCTIISGIGFEDSWSRILAIAEDDCDVNTPILRVRQSSFFSYIIPHDKDRLGAIRTLLSFFEDNDTPDFMINHLIAHERNRNHGKSYKKDIIGFDQYIQDSHYYHAKNVNDINTGLFYWYLTCSDPYYHYDTELTSLIFSDTIKHPKINLGYKKLLRELSEFCVRIDASDGIGYYLSTSSHINYDETFNLIARIKKYNPNVKSYRILRHNGILLTVNNTSANYNPDDYNYTVEDAFKMLNTEGLSVIRASTGENKHSHESVDPVSIEDKLRNIKALESDTMGSSTISDALYRQYRIIQRIESKLGRDDDSAYNGLNHDADSVIEQLTMLEASRGSVNESIDELSALIKNKWDADHELVDMTALDGE